MTKTTPRRFLFIISIRSNEGRTLEIVSRLESLYGGRIYIY